MPPTNRSVIYSLLTVVLILLLGMMAMLGVSYQRYQRLDDQRVELQRNLIAQQRKIAQLEKQLRNCNTAKPIARRDTLVVTKPLQQSTSTLRPPR